MKKQIRREVITLRDRVDKETRTKWDKKIYTSVVEDKIVEKSKIIFIFVSFGSEIDTHPIIEALLHRGHRVCVPRLEGKEMKAVEISSLDNMKKTKYALEPIGGRIVEKEDIDLILVPGVAFDIRGNRIGYGGGYYDRFMEGIRGNCVKIAIAYEMQVLGNIPVDNWDIGIDALITEKQKLCFTEKLLN